MCRLLWILRLFAGHYDNTSGAIRVPEFKPTVTCENMALINSLKTKLSGLEADEPEVLEITVKLKTTWMYPKGALALCRPWHGLGSPVWDSGSGTLGFGSG